MESNPQKDFSFSTETGNGAATVSKSKAKRPKAHKWVDSDLVDRLNKKMAERRLNIHAAAVQMGIGDETLRRFIKSWPCTERTIESVRTWVESGEAPLESLPIRSYKMRRVTRSRKATPAEIDAFKAKAWRKGLPYKKIGNRLGMSYSTVNSYLNGNKISFNNHKALTSWAMGSNTTNHKPEPEKAPVSDDSPSAQSAQAPSPARSMATPKIDILNPEFLSQLGLEANMALLELIEQGELSSSSEAFKKARMISSASIDLAEILTRQQGDQ